MSRDRQKINAFFDMVQTIGCLSQSQTLKVGCIAIRKDWKRIASFGYNGGLPKQEINPETGGEEDSLLMGESGLIHAEINMVSKFHQEDPEKYYIFLTHSPCKTCAKLLVTIGFRDIYWLQDYRETHHLDALFNKYRVNSGNKNDLLNNF